MTRPVPLDPDDLVVINPNEGDTFLLTPSRATILAVTAMPPGETKDILLRVEQNAGFAVTADSSISGAFYVSSSAGSVSWVKLSYNPFSRRWDAVVPDLSSLYDPAGAAAAAQAAAQAFATAADAVVTTGAEAYADAGDVTTLTAANDYTDTEIAALAVPDPAASVASMATFGASGVVGTSPDYARADHAHEQVRLGSSAGQACEGNDSRLSNARTPNGTGWTMGDGENIALATTTGTKIGTGSTQKLGFFGVSPVVQQLAVSDPAGGGTVDTECRDQLSALLARLRNLGLIAT